MKKTKSLSVWINAYDLKCSELKHNPNRTCWVALNRDPCINKDCENSNCRNYGLPFPEQDKLLIVVNEP